MVSKSKLMSDCWWVYIIQCANDGPLYTGITTDIERRFSEHQSCGVKAAKFLRGKGPLTLVYREQVADKSAALKREIAIKKLSRYQKWLMIKRQR